MPRAIDGTFTLVAGNPVVAGTTIQSVWANATLADLAAGLTDSLSRSGLGGMTAPFSNADGTMLAPGMTWTNEPTSGWYRQANQVFRYSVGNEDIFQIAKAGISSDKPGTFQTVTVGLGGGSISTNTVVGVNALLNNTTGTYNTAVGNNAGINITVGADTNTAIGALAMGQISIAKALIGDGNTAIGYGALYNATSTANANTAVGGHALEKVDTGTTHTAVGYNAGATVATGTQGVYVGINAGSISTGTQNTFVGGYSGNVMTTGAKNTFLGAYDGNSGGLDIRTSNNNVVLSDGDGNVRLRADSTGLVTIAGKLSVQGMTVGVGGGASTTNVAIGLNALSSNTTGGANTAVGESALRNNVIGTQNVAIGFTALNFNTGDGNTAVGSAALYNNIGGVTNTAVGNIALTLNNTGVSNSAFGCAALRNNTSGQYNVAVGHQSLYANTTFHKSTAVGTYALTDAVGTQNTALGYEAGWEITSGSKNVLIGSFSGSGTGFDITTLSNQIVLSDGDGNVRMYIPSTGAVTVNQNTTGILSLPAVPGVYTTTLRLVGADAAIPSILTDGFGSSGSLNFRTAQGTALIPTALLSGNSLGAIAAIGCMSAGTYSTAARATIRLGASENWSGSANGSNIQFSTTANTTTTTAQAFLIDNDKSVTVAGSVAIPAGGTTGIGVKVSSTANFGVFFGSGAPSLSAAKGSLYLRSDGTTTNDRAYINTNGTTGWTAVTTAT